MVTEIYDDDGTRWQVEQGEVIGRGIGEDCNRVVTFTRELRTFFPGEVPATKEQLEHLLRQLLERDEGVKGV